jgi:hypothetical protein
MTEKKEPETEKPRGVTPTSVLEYGIDRMSRHNERLLAENRKLMLEVGRLQEMIIVYEETLAAKDVPAQAKEGTGEEVRAAPDEQVQEVVVWPVRGEEGLNSSDLRLLP